MIEQRFVASALRAIVGPSANSPRRAAKVGGEPPEWILLFADGETTASWSKGGGTVTETCICDAASRAMIIAAFDAKGNDVVVDYEHQTLDDVEAPASGWISALEDRGEKGLWARVEWTDRAKKYIRAGEYRYYSPVYSIDEDMRVTRLHHVAITNWPATHNMNALAEQIAAKARAKFRATTARGGVMSVFADNLKYWLNLKTTTTNNELRAELQKVLDSIPADDQLIYAKADGEEDTTVAALAGYAPVGEPAPAASEIVASKAVLEELDLAEGATLAQVQARVAEIRTPATAVDPAEHTRVVGELTAAKARIAELTTTSDEEKITSLIAANRSKIPPAREAWVRATAKKHGYDHVVEVVKAMKEELPPPVSEHETPPIAEPTVAASTRRVGNKDVPVDQASAVRVAKVQAIQKENPKLSYREASDELIKREKAAAS